MMRYAPSYVPTDAEREALDALLDELWRDNVGESELDMQAYVLHLQ